MNEPDVFDELDASERVALLDVASEEIFEQGELIINQGTLNGAIYIILDGTVSVSSFGAGGRVVNVATLGVGSIVGEIGFLTRKEASASVVAAERVRLLRLCREHVDAFTHEKPGFAGRFYHSIAVMLATRLARTNRRL
jgi:CRP-like cAMP-binding protein